MRDLLWIVIPTLIIVLLFNWRELLYALDLLKHVGLGFGPA